MAEYLLDTNHLSPLVTPGHPLGGRVLEKLDQGHTVAFCLHGLTEMLFGIRLLPRVRQNLLEWQQIRPRLVCYLPRETDAEQAAALQVSLRQRGWQLNTVDALIAAIVLRYELILLTTDKDFLAVPGLQMENWLR